MEPHSWTKQAWEERTLRFDLTPSLATGDTPASVSGVTVWEGTTEKTATMFSGPASISGNYVYAKIIAGESGHTYDVRLRVITTNGDRLEDDLKVLVREIGG